MSEKEKGGKGDVIQKVLIGLVIAALSWVGSTFYSEYTGRVRTMSINVRNTPAFIQRATLPGNDSRIIISGKPVDVVSSVGLTVVNDSGKDWKRLPYKISFIHTQTDEEIKPIFSKLRSSRDFLSGATSRPTGDEAPQEGLFTVVNRGQVVLDAEYYFESGTTPRVNVFFDEIGIDAKVGEEKEKDSSDGKIMSMVFAWALAISATLGTVIEMNKARKVKAELVMVKADRDWRKKQLDRSKRFYIARPICNACNQSVKVYLNDSDALKNGIEYKYLCPGCLGNATFKISELEEYGDLELPERAVVAKPA